MTSTELQEQLKTFLFEISNNPILTVLAEMSSLNDMTAPELADRFANDDTNARTALLKQFDEIKGRLLKYNPSEVFSGLNSLRASVSHLELRRFNTLFFEDVKVDSNETIQVPREIGNRLRIFSERYEGFLRTHSLLSTTALLGAASDLYIQIISPLLFSEGVVNLLSNGPEGSPPEGQSDFLISLNPDNHLSTIVEKLSAIQVIYNEICNLIGVSSVEYPLVVVKLETGSLWSWLRGESHVSKLVTDIVREGLAFVHRNFTKEGRLAANHKNFEILSSAVELESKMKNQGYETSALRDNIKRAAEIVTDNTTTLLAGETKIRVDDQTYYSYPGPFMSGLYRDLPDSKQLDTESLEPKRLTDGNSDKDGE